MYGVDVLVDTFWRIWTDLLDVLGIDGRCQRQETDFHEVQVNRGSKAYFAGSRVRLENAAEH